MKNNKKPYTQAFVTIALLLALSAPSQAKFSPLDQRTVSLSDDDFTINTGPAASLEAKYFQAPSTPYAANRLFPCRLPMRLFDKTRLAQSCN